jgi:cephalosporin-C deacetylase
MKHDFPFDPTYGYDGAALLAVGRPVAPGDFAAFWQRTREQAMAVPTHLASRLIRREPSMNVYEVEFDAWGGEGRAPVRIGGWVTLPMDGLLDRGVVVGHGYGGRGGPEALPPMENAAAIYPCARGFNRSASVDVPDTSDRHVLHGIESRETYVHRGCVVDIWAATSALLEIAPDAQRWLCYAGASFGGGIGALAVPWEPRFKRAFWGVPSFGNHSLRLTLPCVGSGEALRRGGGEKHLPVLQYFDAATAAAHVRIPVMVAAARFDPAVPPPGQFAVYNAIPGEKKLFIHEAAHFSWDGQAAEEVELSRQVRAWLAPPASSPL